jgi:hypothetical protein
MEWLRHCEASGEDLSVDGDFLEGELLIGRADVGCNVRVDVSIR